LGTNTIAANVTATAKKFYKLQHKGNYMGLATLRDKINDAKKATEINDWEDLPFSRNKRSNVLKSDKIYFRHSRKASKNKKPRYFLSIGRAIAEMLDFKPGNYVNIKQSKSAPHLFLIRKTTEGKKLKLYSPKGSQTLNVGFQLLETVKFPADITKSIAFDFKSDGSLIIDISKIETDHG
jgi:hypothetical protein